MGNKRSFIIISVITSLYFVAGILPVFAYSIVTHSYLTNEAIKLYNKNYQNKSIPPELTKYVIDGARREDDPPRWANHFYDPTDGSGLHRNGAIDPIYFFGTWNPSKIWAQNDSEQDKIEYKPIIATILSSIANKKIIKFLPTSDFTYKEALKYWISGDKEMAMFTLGHILHLIEDISVPAHTRNDSHITGDSYEQWAKQFTINNPSQTLSTNLINGKPILLSSLDRYFDELSMYTNNNFYSDDTIGIQSGYKNPKPMSYKIIGDLKYATEENSGIKNHYISVQPAVSSIIFTNINNISVEDNRVLKDYWNLLATKDVKYVAGVINLFFQDVEKYKNDPEYQKKKGKSFFGKIIDSIRNTIDSITGKSSYVPVEEIQTSDYSTQEQNQQNDQQQQDNQDQQQQNNTQETQQEEDTTTTPPVVTNDENKLYKVIRVVDGDTIILSNGDIIRYIGIDTPELSPKQCYSEEATEENKRLVLGKYVRLEKSSQNKDDYGRLVRYVWVGNTLINEELLNSGSARAYTFGHHHQKEAEFTLLQNKAKLAKKGMWGEICRPEKQETSTSTEEEPDTNTDLQSACAFNSAKYPSHSPIILNEIAWMGSTNSASDEWIELYNTTSETINIYGWTLTDKDEQIKIVFGNNKEKTSIPAHTYYLLERTDDNSVPNIVADVIYKGALSNSNEGLQLFNSHCQLIDEAIADPSWQAGNSSGRFTMERDSQNLTWYTSSQINGTPKRKNTESYGGGGGSSSSQSGSGDNGDNDGEGGGGYNESPPQYSNITINEIMYNLNGTDSGREWIEIKNNATDTVDLSNWTLYEDGTQHTMTATQGDNLLSPGEFAIIADDPQTFLTDWQNYNGTLFDSSFSLNNSSDTIALYNSTLEIGSHSYDSSIGGDGNGNTIGVINDIWQETIATPGEINQPITQATTTSTTTTPLSTNILISEVQMDGENPNDEFIELYNPTDNDVVLDEYSIQYISGQATTTNNVYKKNFSSSTIPALGFYLLGHTDGKYATSSDMTYSFSLSGISTGGHIALISSTTPIVDFSDTKIVDSISYGSTTLLEFPHTPMPPSNKSIERMAIHNNICMQAIGEAEYYGNGCDRNGDNDFYIRDNPNPQNSSSFREPRVAPPTPQGFTSIYSSSSVTVDFSWDLLPPNSSSTATMYKITNADSGGLIATTSILVSNAHTRIYEVGKEYSFNLFTCDSEGGCSQKATSTVTVPSFLDGIYAYQDPNTQSTSTIIEALYTQYPFIPDTYQRGYRWKMIVFYLNSEPDGQKIIYDIWQPDDLTNVMPIKYIHCSGGLDSQDNTLILPDTSGFCGTSGGAYNRAMSSDKIGEHLLSAHARPDEHANYDAQNPQNNYVTIAFYSTKSTMPSDGRIPYFGLVATDVTHYQIGVQPTHQSPVMTGDITSSFSLSSSQLTLSWQPATDYDTMQNLINYSIQYTASSSWVGVGKSTSVSTHVSSGDVLSISVKSTDEFGNESNIIGPLQWSYPQTNYILTQTLKDSTSYNFGGKNGTGAKSALAQKIMFDTNLSFNIAETILDHFRGSHEATISLSVYSEANGKPNMTNEIARATAHGLATFGESPMTFYFTNPVTLSSNTPYWILITVENYSAQSGWSENSWRIPISSNNPYKNGDYAKTMIETSGGLNDFAIQQNKDWYLKLGDVQ